MHFFGRYFSSTTWKSLLSNFLTSIKEFVWISRKHSLVVQIMVLYIYQILPAAGKAVIFLFLKLPEKRHEGDLSLQVARQAQ